MSWVWVYIVLLLSLLSVGIMMFSPLRPLLKHPIGLFVGMGIAVFVWVMILNFLGVA